MKKLCTGAVLTGPSVGDRLSKKPFFGIDNISTTIPCTVIHVNKEHCHYTVQFDAGYRETFRFGG